ncbi:MAG: pantoate--beta-alanine ligase [Actinomycetes bacterium]
MIIARSTAELRAALRPRAGEARSRVAFVPTMGSLHEGHISLVRAARQAGDFTVASVFVNPTQFSPGEDFELYPRDEDRDLELLEQAGVSLAFVPSVSDIYPVDFATRVVADPSLTSCLCGASRGPQHFDGVTSVVARLFGLVAPDSAWFGEKDWQQLQVVRSMSADIFPGIEIRSGATVRDPDGLALSSRNARLTPAGRLRASAIPKALLNSQQDSSSPSRATAEDLVEEATLALTSAEIELDYLEIRDGRSLQPVSGSISDTPNARMFVAAITDGVRLIDNAPILSSPNQPDRAATATLAASTR